MILLNVTSVMRIQQSIFTNAINVYSKCVFVVIINTIKIHVQCVDYNKYKIFNYIYCYLKIIIYLILSFLSCLASKEYV